MSKFPATALIFLLFYSLNTYGQKKVLLAASVTESITIDGKINEKIWESQSVATDFIMFEPDNGRPINDNKKTIVKMLYDNNAIYIAALLYDNEPHKIKKEITNRDVFGVSDHFSVYLNGFNDGQQDFRFFVSSAGVQMDCLATEESEDFTWDAIWDSEVTLTDFGWVVEMKIPYAALRFSNADQQTWGLNFMREIKRDNQKYTWNHVDTKIGAVIPQAGILEGIKNIKTPTRLFFIPYTSAYYQQNDLGSDQTLKAGLDIKYGINDSFTLDAILVPDFGQTKFDNAILNLEPFDPILAENRPFFTEGTNLFNKGGLFYSRRIGGSPITDQDNLQNQLPVNEEIINFPSTVNLLNAVKVSGRTENGLGVGFLNAVTKKTYATILNNDTNGTRQEIIEPVTNYNVLVFDQRFNQNSSISFVNTNTTRNGAFRDANVSALLYDLKTKSNTYNLYGDFKYSSINTIEDYDGLKTELNFAKTSGKYRYILSGKYISAEYDINDLGIINYTNYNSFAANASYRILNPTNIFNTFKVYQELNLETQNTTGKTQEAYSITQVKATTVKNNYFELFLRINPIDRYDFYEPRAAGRYVYIPKSILGYAAFVSDQNKPFTYEVETSITKFDESNRATYLLNGGVKYRFNDKLSLANGIQYTRKVNDRGWVDQDTTGIIFAARNREIVQNDITGKYAINNRMTLNLTARYYWSYSQNHEFLTLQDSGHLAPNDRYSINKNRNFNSWNFDLSYSWWFAPGSEIAVLYRNYAQESTRIVEKKLSSNVKNVFDTDLTSIFSVSLRYFIDYNLIHNKF